MCRSLTHFARVIIRCTEAGTSTSRRHEVQYFAEVQVVERDGCLGVDVLEVPAERAAAEPPPKAHALFEVQSHQRLLLRRERCERAERALGPGVRRVPFGFEEGIVIGLWPDVLVGPERVERGAQVRGGRRLVRVERGVRVHPDERRAQQVPLQRARNAARPLVGTAISHSGTYCTYS